MFVMICGYWLVWTDLLSGEANRGQSSVTIRTAVGWSPIMRHDTDAALLLMYNGTSGYVRRSWLHESQVGI